MQENITQKWKTTFQTWLKVGINVRMNKESYLNHFIVSSHRFQNVVKGWAFALFKMLLGMPASYLEMPSFVFSSCTWLQFST